MDGNMLNTTYGNIVRRNRTGLNAYINWMPRSNTRLFLNGDVNYTDIRSSRLKLHNSGWQASAMLGVQQTLPAEIKLGAFLMASTKKPYSPRMEQRISDAIAQPLEVVPRQQP